VRLRPGYLSAHLQRGAVLAELGRHTEALEAFDRALHLDPGHPRALYQKAAAHRGLGQLEEAVRTYDQAIAVEPNLVAAHVNRAVTLDDLGRHAEAVAGAAIAIGIEEAGLAADAAADARGHAFAAKAVALMNLERYREALVAIDAAIASGSDDARNHCHRGFILEHLGRYEEAQLAYRLCRSPDRP
jgi:tetratricopeptide (TPR) repeat protein